MEKIDLYLVCILKKNGNIDIEYNVSAKWVVHRVLLVEIRNSINFLCFIISQMKRIPIDESITSNTNIFY